MGYEFVYAISNSLAISTIWKRGLSISMPLGSTLRVLWGASAEKLLEELIKRSRKIWLSPVPKVQTVFDTKHQFNKMQFTKIIFMLFAIFNVAQAGRLSNSIELTPANISTICKSIYAAKIQNIKIRPQFRQFWAQKCLAKPVYRMSRN